MEKNLIVGFGNILLCDEGVGITVVKELENRNRINESIYYDMGTSSHELPNYFSRNTEKVFIIDSIRAAAYKPGTVFKLSPWDLKIKKHYKLSLHQISLIESLSLLALNKRIPEIIFVGIVPADIETRSMELSDELTVQISAIIDKVESIIVKLT